MKVAVLGCGAIGGLILGYLSKEGKDIIGIVRDYQKDPLSKEGLNIEGVRASQKIKVKVDTKLKEKVDLAILAVKTNDLEGIVRTNLGFLKDAFILSTQNGVEADYLLSKFFPRKKIVTGIVMFGATFYPPNKIVHNFEGGFVLGNIYGAQVEKLDEIVELLSAAFKVAVSDKIKGAKYLKLFINLNNCIPAILGVSMQEAFSDLDLARLAINLNKEAYKIITKAAIGLESLPDYPKERIDNLVNMPSEQAAAAFSKIMAGLSKEPLYGSILQSIKYGRKSEIDYINGEIVHLAQTLNLDASLNKRMVELVHKVEETNKFLSKEELFS